MTDYFYNAGLFFKATVASHGDKAALRYEDHIYSHAELSGLVNKLASLLLNHSLKHGDVIAIGNNKRPLSYALMLAALRLGIAYVNIDVASPLERNKHILNTCSAKLFFYDDETYSGDMKSLGEAHQCPVILLDEKNLPAVSDADIKLQTSLTQKIDGSTIAYIMFTSGSTGIPKGVAVTHQNVLHFIAWGQQRFSITPEDNFANLSPMYFDNSVFDFYVGLFSGASLTPVYRDLLTKPYDLINHIGNMQCSIWFSVPSLLIYLVTMKAMTAKTLTSLRSIVFGGEGYPKAELVKLYNQFSAHAKLVNVYGPTECTCICSAYTLSDDDFINTDGLPPLGSLNENFDYCILDDNEQEAATGELCLIGPNVAAGYFNDIERTNNSFFTLTTPQRFMKRMYKTGDIVKEIDDALYFAGRKDNQIKHMGYRIELEEIEQALVKITAVNQAAVIYLRSNTAYGKLIGFVATTTDIDESFLLAELRQTIPDYMLPGKLVIQRELPKNANGKVDRQQLQVLLNP